MIFRVQNVPKVRHVKWENKTYYLSMINSLNNKYIKTYCDRIILVQFILSDVVACFS